MLVSAEKLEN